MKTSSGRDGVKLKWDASLQPTTSSAGRRGAGQIINAGQGSSVAALIAGPFHAVTPSAFTTRCVSPQAGASC